MQTGRPVHSFSSYPSYLLPGDSIAKYFNTRRDGGSWDDLAPLRPPFSSPPLPSFASSCTTRVCHMARTFHPLSRKGIRANDHRDTNQGEARSLVIDRFLLLLLLLFLPRSKRVFERRW